MKTYIVIGKDSTKAFVVQEENLDLAFQKFMRAYNEQFYKEWQWEGKYFDDGMVSLYSPKVGMNIIFRIMEIENEKIFDFSYSIEGDTK